MIDLFIRIESQFLVDNLNCTIYLLVESSKEEKRVYAIDDLEGNVVIVCMLVEVMECC